MKRLQPLAKKPAITSSYDMTLPRREEGFAVPRLDGAWRQKGAPEEQQQRAWELLDPAQEQASGGGEHSVDAVSVAILEVVAAHTVIVLETADHWLKGGATSHLAANRLGDATDLADDPDLERSGWLPLIRPHARWDYRQTELAVFRDGQIWTTFCVSNIRLKQTANGCYRWLALTFLQLRQGNTECRQARRLWRRRPGARSVCVPGVADEQPNQALY
jgi:hypothetical protein